MFTISRSYRGDLTTHKKMAQEKLDTVREQSNKVHDAVSEQNRKLEIMKAEGMFEIIGELRKQIYDGASLDQIRETLAYNEGYLGSLLGEEEYLK